MLFYRVPLAAVAVAMALPAQAAVVNSEPKAFISSLSSEGLAALKTGNRAAAKAKFRTLLAQHVAVDAIGDSLISSWSAKITPAQRAAYKQSFPNYIIGTYADLLFEYASAQVNVRSTRPSGAATEVVTQVVKPGEQPVLAVWRVNPSPAGYKVSNLTVAGINLILNQRQAFNAKIQREGFDKFLAWMKAQAA